MTGRIGVALSALVSYCAPNSGSGKGANMGEIVCPKCNSRDFQALALSQIKGMQAN